MVIKLLKENDPLLREVSTSWDFNVDGNPSELVKSMGKVMMENNGIGLAAPQVGVLKRIFVMGNVEKFVVCINPEIINGIGEVRDIEGCLSFPDLWLHVKRYETINVRYTTVENKLVENTFSGLIARVFQHELEHLDGVCFDTKVGPVSLDVAKRRRKKKLR